MFIWITLELSVFYNDILRIKNNKYYFWIYVLYLSSILKIHKFISRLHQKYFFYFLTKYIFIFGNSLTEHYL